MNVSQYYAHIRGLGPFPAHECLRLAREAAADDVRAEERAPLAGPSLVSYEVQAGRPPLYLSFQIKCF